jgi:small ligand-binding sensory domain FIST
MRWASAVSDERDFETAVAAAAAAVRRDLPGAPADLVVAFVSTAFASDASWLADQLRAALPHRMLLGCTAEGVIGGGREVEQRPALALTAAHLPNVAVTPFVLAPDALPDEDAPPAAWHAALDVRPDPAPEFIILADPFSCRADALLAGLDYAYPRSTKVGGLASAARQPGENLLLLGDAARPAGAVGVALTGDVRIDTVVAQGCRPIGRPLQITRCHENLLLELERQSPLGLIRQMLETLDERDRELVARNLFVGVAMDALPAAGRGGDFLIRNLIGVDAERGILAVGERLRDGQTVQFHVRDARTSGEDLAQHLDRFRAAPHAASARGALLFSCLGRGAHLYGAADHDTGLFRDRVGPLPLGGFFCNGEIGPVAGATRLHGYTSSFGIFRPAGAPD